MALTFSVCQLRPGSANFTRKSTGALEKTIRSHQIVFEVIANGITDPSEVDEVMAGQAAGLPTVGTSVYSDKQTGQIFPYFFCDSKSVTRDLSNAFRFEVRCTYKDEEDGDAQDTPADPEDLCPIITFSSGEVQKTAWDAYYNGTTARKAFFLPTGDKYDAPLLKRVGTLIVSHTQYENAFNELTFASRIMKTNSDIYRGYDPGHAMITSISWSAVKIPVTPSGFINTNKVSYTIECLDWEYNTLTETATQADDVSSDLAGHHELRVRSSDRFLANADDLDSIVSNVSAFPDDIGPCLIKKNGLRFPKAVQGSLAEAPPVDKWLPQETTSFSFLRSC